MSIPPQGTNPYAQPGPNPYGQPAPGGFAQQGGYQQPGGYPPPGFPPPQNGGFPPPMPAPVNRGGGRRGLRLVISLVVIVGVVIAGYILSKSDPAQAKDGSCIKQTGTDSVKVVDCSSAEAQYKVVKRVEGRYDEVSANTKCPEVAPDATRFYAQHGHGTDFLLCMKDK